MATATSTFSFQSVAVSTPGTSIALTPQPYDNTDVIIINNTGATSIRYGIGAAGSALTSSNSMLITTGQSVSLPIGTKSVRPGPDFSGSNSIIIDSVAGAGTVEVQFLNKSKQW